MLRTVALDCIVSLSFHVFEGYHQLLKISLYGSTISYMNFNKNSNIHSLKVIKFQFVLFSVAIHVNLKRSAYGIYVRGIQINLVSYSNNILAST